MKKSNWHSRKKGQCLFLEKISSPFLQPCIWILWSCDSLGVIQNSLIQGFFGLFFFPFYFLLMPVLLCPLRTNCTAASFFRKNQMQALMGKMIKHILTTEGIPWGTWSPEISGINWSGYSCISTHPSLQGVASPGEFSRSAACLLQAVFARTWSSSVLFQDFVTNSNAGAQVSRCWQMD